MKAQIMRAECMMLNKGPFVAEAARMLAKIIRDMEPRQYKKRTLLSKLAKEPPKELSTEGQPARGNEPIVPAHSGLGEHRPSPATSVTRARETQTHKPRS